MKTDSLFYRLFQRLPRLVIDLAGLECPVEGYEFRSEEIKQTAFRLDGVLVPPESDAERPVIFVEVQFQPDPYFYLRFFSEIFLYLRQHPTIPAWRAVVLYPERSTEAAAPPHLDYLIRWPSLHRVYLEDFRTGATPAVSNATQLLMNLIVSDECEALSLAQQMVQHVPQIAGSTLALSEWQDFIETILVYKLPRLSREEIQHMIGLKDIDLKQTRFYQDVFAEGREEGREEGRQQGELLLVQRLLQRRLGPLSEQQNRRIRQLPRERLEALAEALLDFSTPQDLADWLDAHSGGA